MTTEQLSMSMFANRAEHAQRLTLQHHACDQAQRIADLETKCVTLKRLHDAAADERDALRTRLAEIEAKAVPDGCGACGDGCVKRGSCRLVDESPEHKA